MKEVQLLWVYSSLLQAGFGVKSHSHEYYHLISMIEGQMSYTLDGERFNLVPGDIILAPQGVEHKFENSTDQPIRYYEIKFTVLSKALSEMLQAIDCSPLHDSFSSQLVSHIVAEYKNGNSFKDDSAFSALLTLVYHLTSKKRQRAEQIVGGIDTSGFSEAARKVINYLSVHYSESISLDQISAGVGITKTYLCNNFKANTGITIIDCLNLMRIRKAAELIVYSDLSLNQVAELCGYVSSSHFNRIFMKYVGLPPGQCRRAYTGKMLSRGETNQRHTDAFMFSVLAGKTISPSTINKFLLSREDDAL